MLRPTPRSSAFNRTERAARPAPPSPLALSSRQAPPLQICLQRLLLLKSRPLSGRPQPSPSRSPLLPVPAAGPPHLAAATAEPVAAHGVVSQGAFLATVPARAAALLRDAGKGRALTLPTQTLPRTHPCVPRPPPGTSTSLAPAPSRSRTPPPPPRSRSRTQAGPGAGRGRGVGSLAGTLPKPRSHVPSPGAGTLRGLLKRQLPPPSCRNWLYSSMLQRENLRGR